METIGLPIPPISLVMMKMELVPWRHSAVRASKNNQYNSSNSKRMGVGNVQICQ